MAEYVMYKIDLALPRKYWHWDVNYGYVLRDSQIYS